MTEETEEDLTKVKVYVGTCSKCGGVVALAVKDNPVHKSTVKTFSSLMKDGCDVHTTNVIIARSLRWCFDYKDGDKGEKCEGMWPKKIKVKNEINCQK
jgi:hypothetical protein